MSMSMEMTHADFRISRADKEKALEAVIAFTIKQGLTDEEYVRNNVLYPSAKAVFGAENLTEAMKFYGFDLSEDSLSGDIYDIIEFTGYKSVYENELFEVLAPFVKDGSCIIFEVNGEYEKTFNFIGGRLTVETEKL